MIRKQISLKKQNTVRSARKRKPVTFQDEVTLFKKQMEKVDATKLAKKMHYYYEPYCRGSQSNQEPYLTQVRGHMKFASDQPFWKELTQLITQRNERLLGNIVCQYEMPELPITVESPPQQQAIARQSLKNEVVFKSK